MTVRPVDYPSGHPQNRPEKLFNIFWTLDSGCPGSPVRIVAMKVEMTIKVRRPGAKPDAAPPRPPGATTGPQPDARVPGQNPAPRVKSLLGAQTSSFQNFFPDLASRYSQAHFVNPAPNPRACFYK